MKFLHKTDNASARRPAARRALLRRSTSSPQAMTLIELLVSIAILSIMILIFSSILADSQKVVAVSQHVMHANAKAAAIAGIIRNDIRRITQNGLLHIRQLNDDTPVLVFTTAGVSPSTTRQEIGTGMLVCYGITNNSAAGSSGNILWRRAWVLDPHPTVAVQDVWNMDLTDVILALDLTTLPTFEVNVIQPLTTAPTLSVPAQLSDIDNLWQCLTANCSDLSIMWTDGQIDTNLPINEMGWYGVQELAPNNYKRRNLTDPEEYLGVAGNDYRALWTREDQNNWPRAIRIRFVLTDDSVPAELRDTELGETVYEVICPIGM